MDRFRILLVSLAFAVPLLAGCLDFGGDGNGEGDGTGEGDGPGGNNTTAPGPTPTDGNNTSTNRPPVAEFTVTASTSGGNNTTGGNDTAGDAFAMGQELTFDASASFDPDNDTLMFDWDLGDNTTAQGQVLDHTYEAEGNYTVNLTVTDPYGAAANTSRTVVITSDGGGNGTGGFQEGYDGSIPIGFPERIGVNVRTHDLTLTEPAVNVRIELAWTNGLNDFDLYLEDAEGEDVGGDGGATDQASPEALELDTLEAGEYVIVVHLWAGAAGSYAVNATGEAA